MRHSVCVCAGGVWEGVNELHVCCSAIFNLLHHYFHPPSSQQPCWWVLFRVEKPALFAVSDLAPYCPSPRRFVPILTPKMVRYELHLFAEKRETPAQRVGEIILRCAEERDAALVVMATHNKPAAKDKYETYMGSVAQYIMAQCKCPLAVVPPTL